MRLRSPLHMKHIAALAVVSALLLAPTFGLAEDSSASSAKSKPCAGLEGQALRDCRASHPKAMANKGKEKVLKHMKRKAHGLAQKKCKGLTGADRAKCARDAMKPVTEAAKERRAACEGNKGKEKAACLHSQRSSSSSTSTSSSSSTSSSTSSEESSSSESASSQASS